MNTTPDHDNPPPPARTADTAPPGRRWPAAPFWAFVAILAATAGQLAVATFVDGLPQFEGKAFGSRLVFYPIMMSAPVVVWWMGARAGRTAGPMPWTGFALIGTPFLIDVTGNTLDLYDSVVWWDDANHFFNWMLLCGGIGLLIDRSSLRQRWALAMLVAGIGAVLAILWELGEWYTFIRHGTELDTAYTDTLGDEILGTLGAVLAGVTLALRRAGSGRRRLVVAGLVALAGCAVGLAAIVAWGAAIGS